MRICFFLQEGNFFFNFNFACITFIFIFSLKHYFTKRIEKKTYNEWVRNKFGIAPLKYQIAPRWFIYPTFGTTALTYYYPKFIFVNICSLRQRIFLNNFFANAKFSIWISYKRKLWQSKNVSSPQNTFLCSKLIKICFYGE